jgi:lysozyme family protein
MDDNFNAAYDLVRASEGGNDDDPSDPGGRTSRGITQREYDAYRHSKGLSPADVWLASDEEIQAIYVLSYWHPWCPQFPNGLDYTFFDTSVLQGPGVAAQILQTALGVEVDGHIGVITLDALKNARVTRLIVQFAQAREERFGAIVRRRAASKKYLAGWDARAMRVEHDSLKMAGAVA